MRHTWLAAVLAVCLPASAVLAEGARYEANWASLDKRPVPKWFEQARYGIFVVWGPYCVPGWAPKGQYAEWYGHRMRRKGSPTWKYHAKTYGEDFKYKQFGEKLTAARWDPDAWADLFVRAGAKYVVFTANYHDGYCLWPSPYSKGWNSRDVGPKRDVLGEMFAAGRKRGLKMGIYYSLYEWHHPLWVTDRDRYVTEHFHPQFKDVVTRYKPSIIFADGEWSMDYKQWRSEGLLAWLFNDSPCRDEVVVNDRWGQCRGKHGSFYESEYGGGNMSPKHPWQEDRGMGRSYGYNRNEGASDYDSAATMIRMLCKVAGNGGNYLPCVGPMADGRIPEIMRERMLQIGRWLKTNGEAIYGAGASPFWPRKLPWGACTQKPGRIFALVNGRPSGPVELPGLTNKVTAAYFLADAKKRPLATKRSAAGVEVKMPDALPDEAVRVVVLEIEGKPVVDTTIRQAPDGRIVLRARDADIHGKTPRYEVGGGKDNIGYWSDPKDSVSWTFRATAPGEFEVAVAYSCAAGAGGSEYVVSVAKQTLAGKSKETGAWNKFATESLGRVKLPKAGPYTLRVQPKARPKWQVIGLKSIVLRPAK